MRSVENILSLRLAELVEALPFFGQPMLSPASTRATHASTAG